MVQSGERPRPMCSQAELVARREALTRVKKFTEALVEIRTKAARKVAAAEIHEVVNGLLLVIELKLQAGEGEQ